MMHWERAHQILAIDDLDDLVQVLITKTHVLCQGFSWSHLTLRNDSVSEDHTQEYAVFRNGRQVESFSVQHMTADTLGGRLWLLDQLGTEVDLGPEPERVHPEGSCFHCR